MSARWIVFGLALTLASGTFAAVAGELELGLFVACVAAFHLAEFFSVALWRRDQLCARSFAFNGRPYAFALVLGLAEHLLRSRLVGPWGWSGDLLLWAGLCLMSLGGLTRVWAMRTAGRFFNHIVQSELGEAHQLVEDGPYRWLRHPSYFGFYWFSIGTQLLLANPLTLLLYVAVLSRFFAHRIRVEEAALQRRFGDAYRRYKVSRVLGFPA